MQFPTNKLEETVATRFLYDPLPSIETLAAGKGRIQGAFATEQQQILQQMFRERMEFSIFFTKASFLAIIEEVRTKILEWSLELDKAGIRGDGTTFSQEEKTRAHGIVINSAAVTIGVLGEVSAPSNIAVGSGARAGSVSLDEVRSLVADIERHITNTSISTEDARELRRALLELRDEDGHSEVEASKVSRILKQVLKVTGRITDHVIAAGIKVVVEAWMRAHGLVP